MNDVITNIDKISKDLEFCVSVLFNALENSDSVSLNNNDIFKSINTNIDSLHDYDKYYLGELGVSFKIILSHLSKTFSNKDVIYNNELNSVLLCLNDIRKFRVKINNNNSFSKYFDNIKSVSRKLSSINTQLFLKDSDITKEYLGIYENLIVKYGMLINEVNELGSNMKDDDYKNLKVDLEINYSGFKANLKEIYKEILNSNMDIAEPIFNKLDRDISFNNYDQVLKTNMVNKVINSGTRRKELINNFEMLINSMNMVVDRYKDSKIDKVNNKIDIELTSDKKQDDYGLDIPQFIEDNYDNNRYNNSVSEKGQDENDERLTKLITRFEVLKRKLYRIERLKGSLPKEDIKLYNKLESELDGLKAGKKNKIKFHYYYSKLNNRLKLYKNHLHIANEQNKKRNH